MVLSWSDVTDGKLTRKKKKNPASVPFASSGHARLVSDCESASANVAAAGAAVGSRAKCAYRRPWRVRPGGIGHGAGGGARDEPPGVAGARLDRGGPAEAAASGSPAPLGYLTVDLIKWLPCRCAILFGKHHANANDKLEPNNQSHLPKKKKKNPFIPNHPIDQFHYFHKMSALPRTTPTILDEILKGYEAKVLQVRKWRCPKSKFMANPCFSFHLTAASDAVDWPNIFSLSCRNIDT